MPREESRIHKLAERNICQEKVTTEGTLNNRQGLQRQREGRPHRKKGCAAKELRVGAG